MDETLVSESLLSKYFKFTKSDQILGHLGVVRPPTKEVLYMFEVTHVAHMWKFVATTNIDPQNNKSEQIYSHKYLGKPRQSDSGQSPGKGGPSRSFNYLISHILEF